MSLNKSLLTLNRKRDLDATEITQDDRPIKLARSRKGKGKESAKHRSTEVAFSDDDVQEVGSSNVALGSSLSQPDDVNMFMNASVSDT